MPEPLDSGAVSMLERARRLAHPVLILLGVAVLAYGLLLPHMGFYWDELPMAWIRYELGPEAMSKYFSTNRPTWGLLYQVTTAILPQIPIYWEVFALILRWTSAALMWLIAANLWPKNPSLGLTAALAFLLYPGFNQQWTSYLYSHFFLVLCFLLLSFLCSLWAITWPKCRHPLTGAGILLSALHLWMLEYFYFLELLRPILIWRVMSNRHPQSPKRERILGTVKQWVPYALVFAVNILWRQLVFNNQIYEPVLLSRFREAPLAAAAELLRAAGLAFYRTSVQAWAQAFHLPSPSQDGPRTLVFYAFVVIATALVATAALFRRSHDDPWATRWPRFALALGVLAMLLATGPFLLTGLEVTTAYPANRFTLPFILGVSLVLASVLSLLSPRLRASAAIVLFSLAAGRHALWAEAYRQDWISQKALFWQMHWRAPGLAPNTIVLLNEGALPYYADNSLTGALNWIYDPSNRSAALDYVLFYPTSRVGGSLQGLAPGVPVHYDFISEEFNGSTSQVVAFYYRPPGCVRLLRPQLDTTNRLIPETTMMREAAALSSARWIANDEASVMPRIYGPEPSHGWCYYFELAELAAQNAAWGEVAAIGDEAFALSDYPNDPVERFVFIEGYARTGQWERASQLTDDSYRVSREVMRPLLCGLWDELELDRTMPWGSSPKISEVKNMLTCTRE